MISTALLALAISSQSSAFVGVDLRANNLPIRRVLAEFTKQLPSEKFEVDRAVQGNVTTSFINLPYDLALARVLCQVQVAWNPSLVQRTQPRQNTQEQVVRRIAGPVKTNETMSVSFETIDVRDFLRHIFRAKGSSYTMDTGVRGNVVMQSQGETFDSLLSRSLGQVRAAYRIEGDIHQIIATTNPISAASLTAKVGAFKVDKVRRMEALSKFTRLAGLTLEIVGNPNLNDRVSLEATGESVGEILTKLLGAKNTYRNEAGILIVTTK